MVKQVERHNIKQYLSSNITNNNHKNTKEILKKSNDLYSFRYSLYSNTTNNDDDYDKYTNIIQENKKKYSKQISHLINKSIKQQQQLLWLNEKCKSTDDIDDDNDNDNDFLILEHVEYDDVLNDLKDKSKLSGVYTGNNNNNTDNKKNIELHKWLSSSISKPINVCTVTKENCNPIIKTGLRYNSAQNHAKINFILNHHKNINHNHKNGSMMNNNHEINFDPRQVTYGIKVTGSTIGNRYDACIAAIYCTDLNDSQQNINTHNKKCKISTTITTTVSSPSQILNLKSEHNPQSHLDELFLVGYYLNRNLNVLSVSSFKFANIFFQFRLRPSNTNGYAWEFRLIVDRFIFRQMRNYVKLSLFIITLQVYKALSIFYSFSTHCWQGYYDSFKRSIKTISTFEYKYIDKNLSTIWTHDKASANKYELYILIDKFQIEPRLEQRINELKLNIDDETKFPLENIAICSGEEDIFIQFPIDAFVWIIQLDCNNHILNKQWFHHICNNKIEAYFKLIKLKSAGISNYSKSNNRNKHFDKYIYMWGTGKGDLSNDKICGVRLQNNTQTHLFYTIEHSNLHRLGENSNFTMNACNLYHGPGSSNIGQHREDHKFQGTIWTKTTGESSFLTIGAQHRAKTNFIVQILTQNGSYIGYDSQGFCMTIAGHGICSQNLLWKQYNYRLCDIYRFVKQNLINKAQIHDSNCPRNPINDNICECIDPNAKYITPYDKLPSSRILF